MHGPPNQNFERAMVHPAHPAAPPMAALAVSLDSWFSGHRVTSLGRRHRTDTYSRQMYDSACPIRTAIEKAQTEFSTFLSHSSRSTVSHPWTTPGIARWPWRRWRIRSRQWRWIANKWLQLNGKLIANWCYEMCRFWVLTTKSTGYALEAIRKYAGREGGWGWREGKEKGK